MSARPTIGDVHAAAMRIRGLAWQTPMVASPWLSSLTRAEVWLKLEIVQATGSFKMRGAANALSCLRDRSFTGTIVTASAGNHGLATASAARRLGCRLRVHLPRSAPAAKRQALDALGAETVEADSYDDAEGAAHSDAARPGCEYLSPYDDPQVIAGAGTVALEMLAEQPHLDALIVPVGGGGLIAGTAIVARTCATPPTVIGAEAAASPVFTSALAAGRPVTVEVTPTLADGLAGNMEPDSRTFPIVRDLVERVVAVDERAIAQAMRHLILNDRLVAEGAGAVGVAALRHLDLAGRRVGVILSGRNVDADVIARVISGASAATA